MKYLERHTEMEMNERDTGDSLTTLAGNILAVNGSLNDTNKTLHCSYYNRTGSVFVIFLCGLALYIQVNWLVLASKGKRLHVRENTFHFVQVLVHICGIMEELGIGVLVAMDYNKCTLPEAFAWKKYVPMCMLSMKFMCLIGIVRTFKIAQPYRRIPWWLISLMSVVVCIYTALVTLISSNADYVWIVNAADLSCFTLTVIVHSKSVYSFRKKILKVNIQPHVSSKQKQSNVKVPVDAFQIGAPRHPNSCQTPSVLFVEKLHVGTLDTFQISVQVDESDNSVTGDLELDLIHEELDFSPIGLTNIKGECHTFEEATNGVEISEDAVEKRKNLLSRPRRAFLSKIRKLYKYKVSPDFQLKIRPPNKKSSESKRPKRQSHLSISHPSRRSELLSEYKIIASEVIILLFATLFHMVIHITLRMTDSQMFHLVYSIFVLCLYSSVQLLTLMTSQTIRREFLKCYCKMAQNN